jgi:hypothetical protein
MNRSVARLALAIVVAAAAVGCGDDDGAAPEPTVPADWPSFTDPTTGVRFRLPGDPESLIQQVQLPDGTLSEIVVRAYTDGDHELIVSTFALDPDDYSLDDVPLGAARAVGGELVEVRPIDVGGFPARQAEIHFTRDGVDWLVLNHAVLVDTGLVQLQASGPRSDRSELVELHAQLVAGFG